MGSSISSGSRLRTRPRRSRTSLAASSESVPRRNCAVIWVFSERLMELTKSRPSMPESTSSTGWATWDSMISGLAPGYMTLTVTIGTSMLGYSRTARRW